MSRTPPDLTWSEDGRPRSERFDDIYYAADGLDEARAVFLEGCGLPEAWAGRSRFTVAELGFGTGLNILALLQLWRETRSAGGRLHLFSVEAYPLSAEDARRALTPFPEVAELATPLLAGWPGRAPGFHRIDWPELGATLDVATAEVSEALAAWTGRADAWFLDGFAPSRNPEMWRPEVLDLVRARSAPGARLGTFTVAGSVRRGLEATGFTIRRAPGHGRKKQRLEARLPGRAVEPALPRVAIIGGGVAGASLVRAFSRLGAACALVDPGPGSGASGNPVALVSPRLDAGGGPAARLHAQAFTRAVALYGRETPGAVVARGALRLSSGLRDEARFHALSGGGVYAAGALRAVEAPEATEMLGARTDAALWMADALTVSPARILAPWLAGAAHRVGALEALSRDDGTWRLLDAEGRQLAEAEVLVLAAGHQAGRWLPVGLLEPVRGQATWTRELDPPGSAASWGGYLAPLPDGGMLFGATHDRGSADDRPRPEDDHRNLRTLAERLPELAAKAEGTPLQSRASVRAATPDRLPLAGAVPGSERLFVLGGLGGRGFTTAPLLAEHVAAVALGAPSPLPLDLAAAVDPGRFQARAARRASRTGAQA